MIRSFPHCDTIAPRRGALRRTETVHPGPDRPIFPARAPLRKMVLLAAAVLALSGCAQSTADENLPSPVDERLKDDVAGLARDMDRLAARVDTLEATLVELCDGITVAWKTANSATETALYELWSACP